MDFDDLLFRCVNLFELFEEVRDRYRRSFRHVLVDEYQDTNRAQYRWLQLLTRGAPQPLRGRRRRPVDLRLPRRRHPQHPRLRERLPGRRGRQARAELPLDADDPQRVERGDRQQPRSARTSRSGRELGEGDPVHVRELEDEHAEARFVVSEIERLVDAGRVARRDRRLLPHQRAEPRARGHAGALRRRLPGDRRHALLRARGDQGRARLPDAAREPGRHGRVRARRELAAARHRRTPRRRGWSATRTRSASRSGTWRPSPRRFPASRPRRSRRSGASCR